MSTGESIRLDDIDSEAHVAICAMRDAMRRGRSLEGRAPTSANADTSPVTVAGLAIQAIIAARLEDGLPGDLLIAEEESSLFRADPKVSSRVVEIVRQAIHDASSDQIANWIDALEASARSVTSSGSSSRG